MARLKNPVPSKPSSDSSSEEQKEVSEEEEESSEEEETSEKEEDEASETEEEENQTTPQNQKIPPSKSPESNTPATAPDHSDPTKSLTSSKRDYKADSKLPSQTKRLKREVSSAAEEETIKKAGEETKKVLFQRVFSEEDEVDLLNAMLDYSGKKGTDDSLVHTDFYDFIMKSINIGVTKAQLKDKIRRLKTKFKKNVKANRSVSDSHEQEMFTLCKKLWGEEVDIVDAMEVQEEGGLSVKKSWGTMFDKCHGMSGMEDQVLQQGIAMLSVESRNIFLKKWKKVEKFELKAFLQRKELIVELTKVMMKHKKSGQK